MPSADVDSNQGTELSVVVCSSAASIFSPVLFDHLSFKTLTTRKRKHTESFIKVFHDSMNFFFALFYNLVTLMAKF